MYLPITADDLFYKDRDFCGDIRNHIIIVDVVEEEEIDNGDGQPPTYRCSVDMRWKGDDSDDGTVYTYPDAELEDPDDWDAAVEWIASQVG